MKKVLIIANPISGQGESRDLAETLATELASLGFEPETVFTGAKGDAAEAAAAVEEDCAAVCAVGGDGTMNEVLNGIAQNDIPLAILPAGLSNVVAVELGIPRDPSAIARAISSGDSVEMDLCFANGRYFIGMGGAGWDAHIVHSIAQSRKTPLGFPGYVLPIARSLLTYDFPNIKAVLDGATVSEKAGMVIVGNVKTYGGPFKVTNRADFTDGLLDVYLVQRATPAQMLKLFAGVLWGDHTRHGNAKYVRGRKLELTSSGSVPVHIDGEASGHLPRTFETTGKTKRIIVPKQTDA